MKMRHFLKIAFLTPALAISLSLAGLAQSSGPAPGRPGLYEFGSNYCAACKQMKEVIAALKASHGDQVGAPWSSWPAPSPASSKAFCNPGEPNSARSCNRGPGS